MYTNNSGDGSINDMNHEGEDDEDGDGAGGPALPRGVLRPKMVRKGVTSAWAGEEMELEHQRQQPSDKKQTYAAVDITQFQNTVVGKGYQAKHVVRQRTAETADTKTAAASLLKSVGQTKIKARESLSSESELDNKKRDATLQRKRDSPSISDASSRNDDGRSNRHKDKHKKKRKKTLKKEERGRGEKKPKEETVEAKQLSQLLQSKTLRDFRRSLEEIN
jgi:hypothetical protein